MCICVGCLDMLASDGYFTFVASRPQLACAAFIIAEPSEVISLELSDVSIDCSAGDFIKVAHTPQHPPIPARQNITPTNTSTQNSVLCLFRP